MTRKRIDSKWIMNCIPSRDPELDWKMAHAVKAGALAAAAPIIPTSKDLREGWWGIGNQLATGSCVGWATADSVLRWHFVKAGRLDKKERISPRYVWMAAKETDEFRKHPTTFVELEGTSLKAALKIARKYGVVKEPVLPFNSGALFPGDEETFYALAAQLRIATYFNLGRNLQDWRIWLATQGPILTRLAVDETWMRASQTNGKLGQYDPSYIYGGHAVALVGYSPSEFIVRNSWGTTLWGDRGFGYASLAYAGQAFTEAYGVQL